MSSPVSLSPVSGKLLSGPKSVFDPDKDPLLPILSEIDSVNSRIGLKAEQV